MERCGERSMVKGKEREVCREKKREVERGRVIETKRENRWIKIDQRI